MAMPDAAMDRLDFTLPDFTRVAWVSDAAREVWQPRVGRINAAWLDIEWRAVVAGVRRCAIATVSPEELLASSPRWAEEGLTGLPFEIMGVSGQPYASTSVAREPGQPFVFRVVVARADDAALFKQAWDAADDESIGDLLGYPPCCREFFRRVWVDDRMVDTTWPMAVASAAAPPTDGTVEVSGPPQANILWRWMGMRAVPHLPCTFDCEATVALADQLVSVGRAVGFDEEMDWLLDILSWSAEWSALHGIAEVKTPVLKVSTRTDATASRYVVRRIGAASPPEGARGLGLPFETPVKLRLTATRGFRRGLENAAGNGARRPAWYAADNGFATAAAMRDAHRPIVEAAVAILAGKAGNVVDLGCGNGALLATLAGAAPGVVPFGIDIDPIRVEHARSLHPSATTHFLVGDLFDDDSLWSPDRRFALALLMPGRLVEAGAERAAALRARLWAHCDQVLVYAYGDWLDEAGGVASLARQAGFDVSGPTDTPVALATIPSPLAEQEVLNGS